MAFPWDQPTDRHCSPPLQFLAIHIHSKLSTHQSQNWPMHGQELWTEGLQCMFIGWAQAEAIFYQAICFQIEGRYKELKISICLRKLLLGWQIWHNQKNQCSSCVCSIKNHYLGALQIMTTRQMLQLPSSVPGHTHPVKIVDMPEPELAYIQGAAMCVCGLSPSWGCMRQRSKGVCRWGIYQAICFQIEEVQRAQNYH